MGSSLSYELARALDALQGHLTDQVVAADDTTDTGLPVFTWKGQDYPCTPSKSIKGKLFGAGGFTLDNSLVLVVKMVVLPDPGPQPDQFLTYLGDKFRIDLVSSDATQTNVTLTCNSPERGAGIVEREV